MHAHAGRARFARALCEKVTAPNTLAAAGKQLGLDHAMLHNIVAVRGCVE
jgi:hypothetical protein